MLKIGLTGGIGSGKTTVAKIFQVLGIPVYYADAASKRLMQSNKHLVEKIKKHFGEDVYTGDQLNRSTLASIVFNDPQKLKLLNELVHPPTIADAEEWMKQQNTLYVIKEAALLFETGSVHGLDYVIGVQAPEILRIKRAMKRDGISREEVKQRIKRQIDENIKIRLCDFKIYNDEQTLVIPQVVLLHETFSRLAAEAV
jgi:dephospho-CoA kinase